MKDPYVYPGTDILINKFNIKDPSELENAEKEFTTNSLKEIKEGHIKGNFDLDHLKNIHKHIFGDIYPWAGEIRTVNIYKSEEALGGLSVEYSKVHNIETDINKALKKLNSIDWNKLSLDDKAHEFTRVLTDVWQAHGFREGNTRSTVTFFSEFAKEHGFAINSELLAKNSAYVRKSLVIASFEDTKYGINRNYDYLEKIIKHSISDGMNYSLIKNSLSKEIPGIKNAPESLLNKINDLKGYIPNNDKFPNYKEIKNLYTTLGKKIDNGLLDISDPMFKLVSEIKQELSSLKLHDKAIENEKSLSKEIMKNNSIDMEL